jgi:hypothetical protein
MPHKHPPEFKRVVVAVVRRGDASQEQSCCNATCSTATAGRRVTSSASRSSPGSRGPTTAGAANARSADSPPASSRPSSPAPTSPPQHDQPTTTVNQSLGRPNRRSRGMPERWVKLGHREVLVTEPAVGHGAGSRSRCDGRWPVRSGGARRLSAIASSARP